MNIFFVDGSAERPRLFTPPLTGTLLPGVIRDSLLTLATDLGYAAGEEPISVEAWRKRSADGSITEVFACGTAAVITPVGSVRSAVAEWTVGDGEAGPISMNLRQGLLGIQHGIAPDPHGWMVPI